MFYKTKTQQDKKAWHVSIKKINNKIISTKLDEIGDDDVDDDDSVFN